MRKVKFLKSGRFAHSDIQMGQYVVEEGDIVSISEEDFKRLFKAKTVEPVKDEVEDEVEQEVEESNGPLTGF